MRPGAEQNIVTIDDERAVEPILYDAISLANPVHDCVHLEILLDVDVQIVIRGAVVIAIQRAKRIKLMGMIGFARANPVRAVFHVIAQIEGVGRAELMPLRAATRWTQGSGQKVILRGGSAAGD